MTETWRQKKYYDKRVLLDTVRILNPQFDDELLCITGAQLEMLRNLTQYLRRRSTFASEYHEQYYLAPTNAEWDNIQAIVADLEETLMGCTELTTAIDAMAAQLACICQALQGQLSQTQPVDPGYTGQEYYDEYLSPVVADSGSPPAPFGDWEEWHTYVCIGAQKLVDDTVAAVLKMGTDLTTGILITFSVINLYLLLTVIGAPVSIVIQIVTTLVAIGANFAYADVATWLNDNKELLVCSIYTAGAAGEAFASVQSAIADGWDAGPGIQVVQALFNRETISSIFDGTMRDDDLWVGDYTEAYCEPCGEYPEGYTWVWVWPPCPRAEFSGGGVCWSGMFCFNDGTGNATQKVIVSLATITRIDYTTLFKSEYASGWTVGGVGVERWNTSTLVWDYIAGQTLTTSEDAGVQNTAVWQDNFSVLPGGLYRITLSGQVAQYGTEPYPLMFESLTMTFSHP